MIKLLDQSYLWQVKRYLANLSNYRGALTFHIFCSLRCVSKTRRVPKQFPNKLQRSTRNILIFKDISPRKADGLWTSAVFSVRIS